MQRQRNTRLWVRGSTQHDYQLLLRQGSGLPLRSWWREFDEFDKFPGVAQNVVHFPNMDHLQHLRVKTSFTPCNELELADEE